MNITEFKNVYKSIEHSKEVYNQAQGFLRGKKSSLDDYICIFIVGSYGRFEACNIASDIEWLLVYDDTRVSLQEANIFQANTTESFANLVGRERLSIGKTFGEIISKSELITNIGGIADTSRTLTYRMLCLAEGSPLIKNKLYDQIISDLAYVYGGSHTAGHRLLSFASDIARYWRTLRIDYKQKVDEQKKPWAVRGIKLRGTRRYWYFSMIMYFIAYGPRLAEDEINVSTSNIGFDLSNVKDFISKLSNNPTERILSASSKLNIEGNLIKYLIEIYDEYIEIISDCNVRDALDSLKFEDRYSNNDYLRLKNACINLHSGMSDIIINLEEFPRKQVIEMFLL